MSENLKKLQELPIKLKEIAKRIQEEQKTKMEVLKAKLNENAKMIQNKANGIAKANPLIELKNDKLSKFLEAVKEAAKKSEKQN